jgi:RNA 3'-phosphate cyclase
MITIDGSYGEGGGQILRTSIALSILTQKTIRVENIRAKRPQPGIKPQHYTVLSLLKSLSDAETSGLTIGSSQVTFTPKQLKDGSYCFDVGTAGSVVLIGQTIFFALLKTKKKVSIQLTGGTDVKWAPSWDYFFYVFLPLLRNIGFRVDIRLERRGYYPKGGGRIHIDIDPLDAIKPFIQDYVESNKMISGIIHCHGLPSHVIKRLKHAALTPCVEKGFDCNIRIEQSETNSPGIVLTRYSC